MLSGVDPSLLAQLAQPQHLVLLAQRAWHGKCEAQSVALLLLRDLARVHPSQVAAPECGVITLLIGLQASPIPEVVQFAQETVEQLVHLPFVVDEQMEQVCIVVLPVCLDMQLWYNPTPRRTPTQVHVVFMKLLNIASFTYVTQAT